MASGELETLAANANSRAYAATTGVSASARRTSKLRKKESSTTKTAVVLSCVTVLLVFTVAVATHSINYFRGDDGDSVSSRALEDADGDYSQYTCDDIFEVTEANSENRCSFAKTCNSNQGLFAAFVFCNTWNLNLTTWCSILCPFLTIWLVLLFRMLGSTAEDFFSPSLEMFRYVYLYDIYCSYMSSLVK